MKKARERRSALGIRLADLGVELARAVRRESPYSVSAVNDVLWGRSYSADMVEALAKVLDLELPPIAVGEPLVQEWAELGARWHRIAPSEFEREVAAIRDLVEALERFRNRRG